MKFIKFCCVGTIGATIHFATLFLLVEKVHLRPIISSNIGFFLVVIVSYILNSIWTFRVDNKNNKRFFRYVIVNLIGLTINTLVMHIAVDELGLFYIIG